MELAQQWELFDMTALQLIGLSAVLVGTGLILIALAIRLRPAKEPPPPPLPPSPPPSEVYFEVDSILKIHLTQAHFILNGEAFKIPDQPYQALKYLADTDHPRRFKSRTKREIAEFLSTQDANIPVVVSKVKKVLKGTKRVPKSHIYILTPKDSTDRKYSLIPHHPPPLVRDEGYE